ncbi:MAG: hypothetical protein ACLQDV_14550 [Candidatus Binataceae bacterium]
MTYSKTMGGKWWRFSDYEIRDSCIRPARGARMEEYDPWSHWSGDLPLGQKQLSPYGELLAVLTALQRDPGFEDVKDSIAMPFHSQFWRMNPITLGPAVQEELLAWCSRYGLLGLLPHRICQITLPASERAPSDEERKQFLTVMQPDELPTSVARQVQYTRTAGGWYRSDHVPSDSLSGSVLIMSWNGQKLESTALEKISGFFPEIPDSNLSYDWSTYAYPMPLSPEFWRVYAEPVAEFVRAAIIFRDAIDVMSAKGPPRSADRRGCLDLLKGLLSPVGMTFQIVSGKGIRARLSAGSLLATLSAMALQDAPKGQVRQCEECGTIFISGKHPWTRYCKKRCRSAAQQRSFRARKKARFSGEREKGNSRHRRNAQ